MQEVKRRFFTDVNIDLPYDKIYMRLGYNKHKTVVSKRSEREIDTYITESFGFLRMKAAAAELKVAERTDASILFENGLKILSRDLSAWLENNKAVLFLGSTAGKEIVEAIELFSANNELTKAVVFNAVAAETADCVLDRVIEIYNRELRRSGRILMPRRYSAGYGDFKLEYQKEIAEILGLAEIGVRVTPSFMLNPEKSVTALCAIQE